MMLIFAKAAYDAGKYFGLTYDEIIAYGAVGFLFFGAFAPLAAHLSDKISRSFLMIVYHFGIGLSSILAAAATPIFPNTPFIPILTPLFLFFDKSIVMPTG